MAAKIKRQGMRKLFYRFASALLPVCTHLPRFSGPCFVLGSAPNPAIPEGFGERWQFWTVNASQAGVDSQPLGDPDVTVMSAQMLGDRPANVAGKTALKGRRTGRLIVIERGFNADQIVEILRNIGYSIGQLHFISHFQRAVLVRKLLKADLAYGSGEQKVSTGVFAILLALRQGLSPVVIGGLSLSRGGHSYNQLSHKREHVDVDARALALLRRFPVFTTDKQLAKDSGIPLWVGKLMNDENEK